MKPKFLNLMAASAAMALTPHSHGPINFTVANDSPEHEKLAPVGTRAFTCPSQVNFNKGSQRQQRKNRRRAHAAGKRNAFA